MASKSGPGSRGGRIISRRITRGKRKGKMVQGYMDANGRFTALKANKSKNARAGKKFITTRDSKGRRVHTYADGTSVTLKKSRKSKDKAKNASGAATRSGFRKLGRKKTKKGTARARHRPKRKK